MVMLSLTSEKTGVLEITQQGSGGLTHICLLAESAVFPIDEASVDVLHM